MLLGYHRMNAELIDSTFIKVTGFWGTFGYLISKQGARKFVNTVDTVKIDAQIDAYMSWMSQTGALNLYALKNPIIIDNNITKQTDIQIKLVEQSGIDPYLYKGYKV